MKMVEKIISTDVVQSMKNTIQHGDTTCFQHCLFVSYYSYVICRFFLMDNHSAAVGGLLHDLFLYDWHIDHSMLHSFEHPTVALMNAIKYFEINEVESDIIINHMFPLTWRIPKYKETIIICLVDKYCAIRETLRGMIAHKRAQLI